MSLQARVLAFVLALLLVVLAVTLATVSSATYRHTLDRSERELAYARRIVLDKLETRERALIETAGTLTKDDALRQAIFAEPSDRESILVALNNHRLRTSADLAVLIDLDGTVLVDTGEPARRGGSFAYPELLAERSDSGGAPRVVLLDGTAYLIAAAPYYVPVSAPSPSLWLLLGRAVDDRLARELRELTGVEVAIVATPEGTGAPRLLASSAVGARRARAVELATAGTTEVEIRTMGGEERLVAAADLRATGAARVVALVSQPTAEALLDFRELLGRFAGLAALSALLALFGALVIARGVTRPIRALAQAAQKIAAGDYAAELPARGPGEVGKLAGEFAAMQSAVREREAAIAHRAEHDDLTGLPNRTRLRAELVERLAAADRRGRLAVAVMDIDRFREINDTLGHHVGDRLLIEIGERLRRVEGEGAFAVARLGGDEFAILAAVESVADARDRIEALRRRLAASAEVDDLRIDLEASFGIALYPDHGADPATLLRQAEVAMYVAKERRLGLAFYDPSQDRHSIERLSLVGDLRRAIEGDALELAFQPKLDLRTGGADEVEVLLRWEHPRRGRISPAEFVPIAEQTGQIRALTAWVLERGLAQLAEWERESLVVTAAINLSALDLHDSGLATRLGALLARAGVSPRRLVLEITESSVMLEPQMARRILDEVTEMGVRVSIDDFGTGYSSLAQLKRLPVRELKVDRSFIAEMIRSPDVRQIVRSTIELGHSLGLEVVAEGVETAETLAALREMGCDKVQGHHVSEPLTAGQLASWLRRRATTARFPTGAAL